ncbi:hypothetical protein F4813DRAFT_390302 [Daldinia decipiens]|uniref:uncharacterized protein n=1 Tax=Daldinia decipiens TaxID=326647 RepID=UPI0020C410FD|nr:uncharacterized protein F4813DRAFT_390302 [Daldinia decipiens]KAI1656961.1 hypothetical protein F4813DRAFT_390302 [Daldinia decipiens]
MSSLRNILAAALLLVSSVQADYVIDPSSVSLTIRTSWCQSEKSTCPIICSQTPPGTTLVNDCDPKALTYGCVCGDHKQPNVSEYSLTLPYFVCQEWGDQCVQKCGQDNNCSRACREDHPCGAQNPTRTNATTSSAGPTATASGTDSDDPNTVYTGLAGSSEGGGNDGNAAFRVGANDGLFGFAIIAASVSLGVFLL